jgi:hypothetical protein
MASSWSVRVAVGVVLVWGVWALSGGPREPESVTEPETGSESESEPGTEPESEPETETETETGSEPEAETGSEPEAESEPGTETAAAAETGSEPEAETGSEPESEAETGSESESESVSRGVEVKRAWEREERDADWAAARERDIAGVMKSLNLPPEVFEAECRSSVCRVALGVPGGPGDSPEARLARVARARALVQARMRLQEIGRLGYTWPEPGEDGAMRSALYLVPQDGP